MKALMTMAKTITYVAAWLIATLSCGALAALLYVQSIGASDPSIGDGIGMMVFGAIGLLLGALISSMGLVWFAHRKPTT